VTAADLIISLIEIGASAFVATNIDDIFILMVFFSSSNFHARSIVIGQYLGIDLLVAISALGSLIALVVPLIYHRFDGISANSNRHQEVAGAACSGR